MAEHDDRWLIAYDAELEAIEFVFPSASAREAWLAADADSIAHLLPAEVQDQATELKQMLDSGLRNEAVGIGDDEEIRLRVRPQLEEEGEGEN